MISERARIIIIALLTLVSIAGIAGELWAVYRAQHAIPVVTEKVQTADVQKAANILKSRKQFELEGAVPVIQSPTNTPELGLP